MQHLLELDLTLIFDRCSFGFEPFELFLGVPQPSIGRPFLFNHGGGLCAETVRGPGSCAIHQRPDPEKQDHLHIQEADIGNSMLRHRQPCYLGPSHGNASCEFSEKKQEWIMQNFPELEFLFKDIKTLKDKEAVNEVDGLRSRVAAADVFITGFVCKSVSTENNNRHTYSNCIEEASGETGETFSGMMSYIKKHKPMVVIAENVKGITMRNKGSPPVIGQVVDEMRQAGYSFGWKILNTRDFLIPQNRPRCWMIGLRNDTFTQEDVDHCFQMVEDQKISTWSLQKYFNQFKVGKLGTPNRSTPNKRERLVIKAAKLKLKGRKTARIARDDVLVDLAKSEARAPVNLNATPCLVANSRMWWDNQRRFLSAEEGMSLQGIFASDFPQLKSFLRTQSALCRDMTGNAFSMSVCTAVLNAVMLKVAEHK